MQGKTRKGKLVGAVRFELTTSCTRNKRATRLRYAPIQQVENLYRRVPFGNRFFLQCVL
jgi:hypothetical protein